MSFFELYAMGVPLFAPSLNFLTQLRINHWFAADRSYRGRPERSSLIPHHSDYNRSARVPAFETSDAHVHNNSDTHIPNIILDPHDDYNTRAVRLAFVSRLLHVSSCSAFPVDRTARGHFAVGVADAFSFAIYS